VPAQIPFRTHHGRGDSTNSACLQEEGPTAWNGRGELSGKFGIRGSSGGVGLGQGPGGPGGQQGEGASFSSRGAPPAGSTIGGGGRAVPRIPGARGGCQERRAFGGFPGGGKHWGGGRDREGGGGGPPSRLLDRVRLKTSPHPRARPNNVGPKRRVGDTGWLRRAPSRTGFGGRFCLNPLDVRRLHFSAGGARCARGGAEAKAARVGTTGGGPRPKSSIQTPWAGRRGRPKPTKTAWPPGGGPRKFPGTGNPPRSQGEETAFRLSLTTKGHWGPAPAYRGFGDASWGASSTGGGGGGAHGGGLRGGGGGRGTAPNSESRAATPEPEIGTLGKRGVQGPPTLIWAPRWGRAFQRVLRGQPGALGRSGQGQGPGGPRPEQGFRRSRPGFTGCLGWGGPGFTGAGAGRGGDQTGAIPLGAQQVPLVPSLDIRGHTQGLSRGLNPPWGGPWEGRGALTRRFE